ncbi:hypothetical protein QBC35DRAFT_93550 [Podospora australis]|uniref:Uncharacterized protein n=1 Tax=Podospora australis TaxID=1536484 RepID=A0AAN6WYV5_9PEZI|nr:hypothetical protein QBC35DRAFT_93550 [Podospora australis]
MIYHIFLPRVVLFVPVDLSVSSQHLLVLDASGLMRHDWPLTESWDAWLGLTPWLIVDLDRTDLSLAGVKTFHTPTPLLQAFFLFIFFIYSTIVTIKKFFQATKSTTPDTLYKAASASHRLTGLRTRVPRVGKASTKRRKILANDLRHGSPSQTGQLIAGGERWLRRSKEKKEPKNAPHSHISIGLA